jgi:hypothetical protein
LLDSYIRLGLIKPGSYHGQQRGVAPFGALVTEQINLTALGVEFLAACRGPATHVDSWWRRLIDTPRLGRRAGGGGLIEP